MKIKFYICTFNSKGEMFFEEADSIQDITITVKKDNWNYDETTGCWYPSLGGI